MTANEGFNPAAGPAPDRQPADEAERRLRLRRVRDAMAAHDLDALLAFAPGWRRENVRYFTDSPVTGAASFACSATRSA
jgi:Xaa-Pro dipeptidase